MSHSTSQGAALLKGWRKLNRFESGLGERLPEAYKKFWYEWKVQEPAAVHYIPKEGVFERNEKTGIVTPIQNVKIPLLRVPEEHQGIWGGEAIIKGFQKRNPYKRRVPHFWVPNLKRSVVRSEILNEFFSVTVTDRTLRLILDHHGFDHYLLKTPACDLRSQLALKIKQRMLLDLQSGLPAWKDNQQRQKEITEVYGKYLEQFTPEEIEWYGLSWEEAIKKMRQIVDAEEAPVPHKILFRQRLIEQLREAGIKEAQGMVAGAQ
jgi:large subunit ribosomal protein L28